MRLPQRLSRSDPAHRRWLQRYVEVRAAHHYLASLTRSDREVAMGRERRAVLRTSRLADVSTCAYRDRVAAQLKAWRLSSEIDAETLPGAVILRRSGTQTVIQQLNCLGRAFSFPPSPDGKRWIRVGIDNHKTYRRIHSHSNASVLPAADRAALHLERQRKEEVLSIGAPLAHDDDHLGIIGLAMGGETRDKVRDMIALSGVCDASVSLGFRPYILADYAALSLFYGVGCCPFCGLHEVDVHTSDSSLFEADLPAPPPTSAAFIIDGSTLALPGLLHTLCTIMNAWLRAHDSPEMRDKVLATGVKKYPTKGGGPGGGVKIDTFMAVCSVLHDRDPEFFGCLVSLRRCEVSSGSVQKCALTCFRAVGGAQWTIACHVLCHFGAFAARLFGGDLRPLIEQSVERANQRVNAQLVKSGQSQFDALARVNVYLRIRLLGITSATPVPAPPAPAGSAQWRVLFRQ